MFSLGKRLVVQFLLAICFLSVWGFANAGEQGSVSVQVYAQGEPAVGVMVSVRSWAATDYQASMVTDDTGHVTFDGVPTGQFDAFVVTDQGEVIAKGKGEALSADAVELQLEY